MSVYKRVKKWRKRHNEKYNALMKKYRSYDVKSIEKMLLDENEIYFTKDDRIKKRVKASTPKWIDKNLLRNIYQECVNQSKIFSMNLKVIHVIPLFSRKVCGLHVHENLKIVSETLYKKLGRKFRQDKINEEYYQWLKNNGL